MTWLHSTTWLQDLHYSIYLLSSVDISVLQSYVEQLGGRGRNVIAWLIQIVLVVHGLKIRMFGPYNSGISYLELTKVEMKCLNECPRDSRLRRHVKWMLTDKGDLFIVQHRLMEEVATAASLGACTKGGLEGSKELLGWHHFWMFYLLRGDHKPLSNTLPLHIGGFRRLSIIIVYPLGKNKCWEHHAILYNI